MLRYFFNDGITNLFDKKNALSVSENDGNDNGETDGNDNGETDENDNGETENTNNHDYSGAGYTNISTILFGTLMCKIVMIY